MSRRKLVDRLLANECPAIKIDPVGWLTIPIVLADEVCELYHRLSADKAIYAVNEMGPMLPHYPLMWLEWEMPQNVVFDSEGTTVASLGHQSMGWRQGVLLKSIEVDGGFDLKAIVFNHMGADDVILLPMVYSLELNEEGEWRGDVNPDGYPIITVDVLGDEHLDAIETYNMPEHGLHVIKTALLALALMNCRNVKLDQGALPPKVAAARRRRSKAPAGPIERWGVITLPRPARRATSHSGAKAELGGAVPAHIVRSHFKTYTAEHPLLGRAVGRYWWGSFLRGDPDAGRIRRLVHVKPGQE